MRDPGMPQHERECLNIIDHFLDHLPSTRLAERDAQLGIIRERQRVVNHQMATLVQQLIHLDDDAVMTRIGWIRQNACPEFQPTFLEVLVNFLTRKDIEIRIRVLKLLALFGADALPVVWKLLLKTGSRDKAICLARALLHLTRQLPLEEHHFPSLALKEAAKKTRHPEVRNICQQAAEILDSLVLEVQSLS